MARPVNCSSCGKKIINSLSYTHNGKAFCYECFKKMQSSLLAAEDEQKGLYTYIKTLFNIHEIPQETVSSISREVANGKKYNGIRLTLHYYYEVLENPCNEVKNIPFVIRDQYENARKYEEETRKTRAVNDTIDLTNVPVRTVKLKKKNLETGSRKKIGYDISDL